MNKPSKTNSTQDAPWDVWSHHIAPYSGIEYSSLCSQLHHCIRQRSHTTEKRKVNRGWQKGGYPVSRPPPITSRNQRTEKRGCKCLFAQVGCTYQEIGQEVESTEANTKHEPER